MTFRRRLVLTLSAVSALTTAIAFGAASLVVVRSEERQLDEALRSEARQEAAEIATEGRGRRLRISDRGGPAADDVGRLTKYAAIYGEDGAVLDSTETLAGRIPARAALDAPPGTPFDLPLGRLELRGIVVPVQSSSATLLLAASRDDLERDSHFLHEVMLVAALLSIGATVLVTWRVVQRLTRGHLAIAETVHKVAAGDLEARVELGAGDDEVLQLGRDVDEMVRRLAVLVDGQRRFAANAAHELRSPLTSLCGELQHALRRERTAEEYRAAIGESLDAARRLTTLAESLLVIARTGSERDAPRETVAIDAVAKSAASWLTVEARLRRIRLTIVPSNIELGGDALDLERMLRNLLDNAVRHSPDGGEVVVRAEIDARDDHVVVTVADEGPGVPEADRERVFEPFFRSAEERRRERGSGLGLAIVREIAARHGGDVTVGDAASGKGAVFTVRLPRR